VSIAAAHLRVAEIQQMLQPVQAPPPQTASFTGALQGAMATTMAPAAAPVATAATAPNGVGQAILNAVTPEVGVAEQPPGSNDSPRIAQYRQATAGSGVGPWCAYFVSWAARQAGAPIGDAGQGYGRVDDVYAWAERTGKAIPVGQGAPQPGDLIVWDEHIGIVESVGADGSIRTIEGNSSDAVSQRSYGSDGGGAIGFVRLG
jgi:CHAP domain